MLKALDVRGDSQSPFNRAVIAMAAGCGLEPAELATITRISVYRSDGQLWDRSWIPEAVGACGKKRPLCLLYPQLRSILEDYREWILENKIHAFGKKMDLEQPLFCRPDGKPFTARASGNGHKSNYRTMSALVQDLISRTPIAGTGVTPKSLRHSFVIALYLAGYRYSDDPCRSLRLQTGYSEASLQKILPKAPSYYEPLMEVFKTPKKPKRKPL